MSVFGGPVSASRYKNEQSAVVDHRQSFETTDRDLRTSELGRRCPQLAVANKKLCFRELATRDAPITKVPFFLY